MKFNWLLKNYEVGQACGGLELCPFTTKKTPLYLTFYKTMLLDKTH